MLSSPGKTAIALLLAGALAVAGFAPLGWWPLVPASLAILFHLWSVCDTPRRAAWYGFLYGLAFFLTGVSWIFVSLNRFGGMPALLAAIATTLYCAFLALFPALVGSLQARSGASRLTRLILFIPALWTIAEWVRGWVLTGFPWLAIGYSQVDTPLAGYAPLLGVYGVHYVLALFSALLVAGLRLAAPLRTRALLGMAALAALGYGMRAIDWTTTEGEPLRVALVQGNIPQSLKFNPGQYEETLATYRRLVEGSQARLIVLPETAIPRFLEGIDARYLSDLERHARLQDGDLLLGVPLSDRSGRFYNSVVNLGASAPQSYSKRHLVPLGEFVPPEFGWIIRVLSIPLSDFTPGPEHPEPLVVAGTRVGVNICYEDAFGEEIIRQLPKAALLANVSNVAWFGDSLAPEQHLQISRMRALETGRVMLRATNTGVTAVVHPDGQVAARLPQFTEGVLEASVQGRTGATPYVQFGNAPILAFCATLPLIWLCLALRSRRLPGSNP